MPTKTNQTQKLTEDAQKKIVNAVDTFYEVQLALQKTALETARNAFGSAIDFQRKGLDAITRSLDSAMMVQPMNESAFTESVGAFVKNLPGMTPETADKIVADAAGVIRELQGTATRTRDAAREVATRGVQQYGDVLRNVEARSKQGFDSFGNGAETATKLAERYTDAWVDAVFNAFQVATKASEETSAVVVESAEEAVKAAESANVVLVKAMEESAKAPQ